jgi:hypothetical protein
MDEQNITSQPITGDNVQQSTPEEARGMYYCFLCGAELDENKCCTDEDCPLYGIPQG